MTTSATGTGAGAPDTSALIRFAAKFGVLKGALPELWIVFAIKLLVIAAYQLTNLTIFLWLGQEFGYNDVQSAHFVAIWAMTLTVATLLVGSLTDALGIRRTLFLGVAVCIVARSVMVLSANRWLAIGGGLMLLAVGEALTAPVLLAATRRYSTTPQRSISFSLVYVMMNAGIFVATVLFDFIRKRLGEHGHAEFLGFSVSTYRVIFLGSLLFQLLLLPLVYLLRDGAEADGDTPHTAPTPRSADSSSSVALAKEDLSARDSAPVQSAYLAIRHAALQTCRLFTTLAQQRGFYQLLAFLVLIAFIKLIYKQMDYVYPTFGIRELGQGAPFGVMWGMNSLYIIILAPLIGVLTQKYPAYAMVTVGAIISSASIFIMALPPAWFQAMANGAVGNFIGHRLGLAGTVNPYYVMIALFVMVLSVGEAFYSPRVYEYAAAIAPKGQEASYGALSYIPFLLAKFMIGAFSGESLMRYCPATGPRHSETLWLLVALCSLVAPIGLILFRPLIRLQEAGRNDSAKN
jgi:MFS family permease